MSKTAFIFPGMGKDCYEAYPKAAEIYDMASDLLKLDMKALCFEGNDKLDLTEYTQAALVTTCLAMEKVLEEAGVKPDITAGLSLGEYCAIHAAGGMSAADAIRTVRERGILMQDTVPAGEGGMAAVLGMEAAAIEEGLRGIEGVWIANYNCPGQIVITGRKAAVEKASQVLKEKGARRVLPLNVSGPFHSPMLEPAGEKLLETLNQVEFTPLQIPYVTNVTAEPVTDIRLTKELLKQQVSSSVRWQQSMEYMLANGVDTFVEIGPGKTLTGFLRKIDRSAVVYQVGTCGDMEKVASALA